MGGSANMKVFLKKKIAEGQRIGLSEEESRKLAILYGTNVNHVYAYLEEGHSELPPILYGQFFYAIQYEMAIKPVDFFIRRTGDMFFNINQVKSWKVPVIEEMSTIFGWSVAERKQYAEELEEEKKSNACVIIS